MANEAITATYGFLGCFGLITNGFAIYILLHLKNWSTPNLLIMNQCIIDGLSSLLALCVFLDPQIMTRLPESETSAEFVCKVWSSKYLFWSSMQASIGNIVVLTVDRYFAVLHPIKYKTKERSVKLLVVVIPWICGFGQSISWFVVHTVNDNITCTMNTETCMNNESCILSTETCFLSNESWTSSIELTTLSTEPFILSNISCILSNEACILSNESHILSNESCILRNETCFLDNETCILNNESCILSPETSILSNKSCKDSNETCAQQKICELNWPNPEYREAIGILYFIYVLVIPVIVMTFVYIKIFRVIRNRPCSSSDTAEANQLNIIKTFFIVCVVYVICWTPNAITFLLYTLGGELDFNGLVYHTTAVISLINNCLNPIIYTFKYKDFKNGVKTTFPKLSKMFF